MNINLEYLLNDVILELLYDENHNFKWKNKPQKIKTFNCFCINKHYYEDIDTDELSKIIYNNNNITFYFPITSSVKTYISNIEEGFTLQELIDNILEFMNIPINKNAMKNLKFYYFEGLIKFPNKDQWDICWSVY